jgi:hypothetical protein
MLDEILAGMEMAVDQYDLTTPEPGSGREVTPEYTCPKCGFNW